MSLGKFFPAKSAVFITLHKCASQFFSRRVLPRLRNHAHVDYQWLHYENRLEDQVAIRKRSHIYGPVRILECEHPSYGITDGILSDCMKKRLKAVFFVRDPRDILVSMYFSFGFSHPISPNVQIREYQLRRRRAIQSLDLNTYVIEAAPELRKKFCRLLELADRSGEKLILNYEQMIDDFSTFFIRLDRFLGLQSCFKQEFFFLSRPLDSEHPGRHKRDGSPGGYLKMLQPSTVDALNGMLGDILDKFGYRKGTNG